MFNSYRNFTPLKIFQNRSDVLEFWSLDNGLRKSILDMLETMYLIFRNTIVQRVAVVKLGVYDGGWRYTPSLTTATLCTMVFRNIKYIVSNISRMLFRKPLFRLQNSNTSLLFWNILSGVKFLYELNVHRWHLLWRCQDNAEIWSENERCSSNMKPRLRANWVVSVEVEGFVNAPPTTFPRSGCCRSRVPMRLPEEEKYRSTVTPRKMLGVTTWPLHCYYRPD